MRSALLDIRRQGESDVLNVFVSANDCMLCCGMDAAGAQQRWQRFPFDISMVLRCSISWCLNAEILMALRFRDILNYSIVNRLNKLYVVLYRIRNTIYSTLPHSKVY